MVVEDVFYVVVTVLKVANDPRQDLLHLIVGKQSDTLENITCAFSTSRVEGPRNDPAIVTDEPDRQTLDGKRCAMDHR